MTDQTRAIPKGLDDIRNSLLSIVQEGRANRSAPIHLTWVGGEFARQKGAPFEQYINYLVLSGSAELASADRKMLPFVEKYCADILQTSKLPNGAVIVSLPEPAEPAPASPDVPVAAASPGDTYKFRKGVWLAFIRPLLPGQRRYLNMDKLGFTDLAGFPPAAGGPWLEIGREFIAGIAQDQPVDGPLVQHNIRHWTETASIGIDLLVDTGERPPDPPRSSLSDLVRIIESLPTEVARQWVIPAEVLTHLRRS